MQRVEKMIRVGAPVQSVYDMWHDFERFPEFMENVQEVRTDGFGRSHWRIRGPMNNTMEYDAQLTEDDPNRSIGWRSIEGTGDLQTSGAVTFTELGDRETEIRVVLQWFDTPGGPVGEALSRVLQNPDKMLEDDLLRFKHLVEGQSTGAGMTSGMGSMDGMSTGMSTGGSMTGEDRLHSMDNDTMHRGMGNGSSGVMHRGSVSDFTYDLITALQSKLEAITVYETFVEDCREAGDQRCAQIFEEIWRDDERHAQMLSEELERVVRAGHLTGQRAA